MPVVENHAAGTPSWFDLMTPELEKARAFYGVLFGWTYDIAPAEYGGYSIARRDGRIAAGIGPMAKAATYPTAWSVYFATDDAVASASRVKALGGSVPMEPIQVGPNGTMLMAADPTGAVFGMWQPGTHKGAEVQAEPGAMAWCEAATRDADKARAFYVGLLGLEAKKMPAPDLTYWTLHHGEPAVAGILQMNEKWPADLPPHWMIYFAVADTDASVDTLKKEGGRVHVAPFDSPFGRMSVVADPWGAVFTLAGMQS